MANAKESRGLYWNLIILVNFVNEAYFKWAFWIFCLFG